MNYDIKKDLVEKLNEEFGAVEKFEDDGRTLYIANSNTLKINKSLQDELLESNQEEKKAETDDEKLQRVLEEYNRNRDR